METIGDRVKKERARVGLTQQALAAAVGLKKETVRDLELGKSRSTTKLHNIAEALGVRVSWLETGKGPREMNASPSGTENKSQPALPSESHSERINDAIVTSAKRLIVAEELIGGLYPRDELVDRFLEAYVMLLENGGRLPAKERQARIDAAQRRRDETGDADDGLSSTKGAG